MASRTRTTLGRFAANPTAKADPGRATKRRDLSVLALSPRPQIVAVCSARGSVGRSTISAGLAAIHGAANHVANSTLLVDLDTFAPSQSVIHAREQVTAGVLGAARLIRQERYSAEEHARLTVALERYDLLSGITSHERWPELDDFSVGLMLHELAGRYEQVVIDLGGCAADTEVDPESGIRRNVAGAKVLEMADVVLLVTAADPVSLARLVAELPAVRPLVAGRLMVVVNRTRNDSIGGNAQRQITQLIEGLGVASHDIVFLPDDPTVCDQALASGVAVTVARPRSGLAKALRELAARLNSSHVHSSRVSQAERQG